MTVSAAVLALGIAVLLPGYAVAQEGQAADTTKKEAATKSDGKTAESKPAEARAVKTKPEVAVDPAAPYKNVAFAKGEKPRVVMETTMGKMVLELWPDVAPKHCQSFVHLVGKHYFDSVSFHRIIAGFVIQGGDPQGTGAGGPGYTVPAEFSDTLKHDLGILSMARTPDPNSAGSQFFICLSRERTMSLDKQYTIFGKVVEGLDVVEAMGKVPTGPGDKPLKPVLMTKVYMEKKS
jgi:cyclophilin family peptidyl-prolyl cis-trans isomerase